MAYTILLGLIIAPLSLYLFTLVVSFYHMFESNKGKMDNYVLVASIVFAVIFIIAIGRC